jgi:hypothetical protein
LCHRNYHVGCKNTNSKVSNSFAINRPILMIQMSINIRKLYRFQIFYLFLRLVGITCKKLRSFFFILTETILLRRRKEGRKE